MLRSLGEKIMTKASGDYQERSDAKFTNSEFRELYNTRLSDDEIARRLGVHRVTVRLRRVRLGLSPNDPKHNVVVPSTLTSLGCYLLGALVGDGKEP